MLRVIAILVTAAGAGAQPVSYSRQVAPILAMNCHFCHGANPASAAGGLSTRTWADLMRGGNLGPAIIAGDPQRSALYQFISGARGEAHRMPLGGAPLEPEQIDAIRRWIAEGAAADADATRPYRIAIPSVKLDRAQPVRFSARVPAAVYVSLELTDHQGRILYEDGGALREDRGVAAIGAPGEWIGWNLRRAPGWPAQVRASLTVSYSGSEPINAALATGPEFPAGDTDVRVVFAENGKAVLHRKELLSGGFPDSTRWGTGLPPGLYLLQLSIRSSHFSLLFRGGP